MRRGQNENILNFCNVFYLFCGVKECKALLPGGGWIHRLAKVEEKICAALRFSKGQ
jgi:hypothetical protein